MADRDPIRTSTKGSYATEPLAGNRIVIVALGASAGGLEAFERFFNQMPSDSGMAFVLVQHLDSEHKSILSDLIGQYTTMPVAQITDRVKVQPNCVYVIPPDRDLSVLHDTLHIMEPVQPRHQRLTIDNFLRSLADDKQERAACIILSGTGSDGTLGLKAIKEAGGVVMVQEPVSAKFDGMPASAVQTGLADFILPPEEMPAALVACLGSQKPPNDVSVREDLIDSLQKVFIILRSKTGHDFSQYKENTILRRVQRRMAIKQIHRLDHYVKYLQKDREEVKTLFKELLIGVSSFFRDREVFDLLEERVIPDLIKDRGPDQPLRIWVPGCATGEEAYSLAILCQEQMDVLNKVCKVQIFTTDLDHQAIEAARRGIYPDTIAADVSPERLNRFFSKDGSTYQVNKRIREMLVIAEQNVIKDPPFSGMDLISCRNLLIYFGATLQAKVLPIFHYALKPNGYLQLGTSETTDGSSHLFEVVSRKWKLYRRKAISAVRQVGFEIKTPHPPAEATPHSIQKTSYERAEISLKKGVEALLLAKHTPACVIINEHYEAIYIHGRTGQYLEAPTGRTNWNLLKLAREGLLPDLTTAVRKAKTEESAVRYDGLSVQVNGGVQHLNLLVRPLVEPEVMAGCMAVIFESVGPIQPKDKPKLLVTPGDKDQRIAELEKELRSTKEYLQTTIEELESSNEEMKSTNEEMQASNEELQSANEELETSKEEGQSINEELTTVNSEHQEKITALSKANDDMANYLASTEVGVIFLDLKLRIRRFTPRVTEFIKLIPSDIGRPLGDIATSLISQPLSQEAEAVLEDLVPREKEVQITDGKWFFMRMKPYRTTENVIDGVVITFMDITLQKQQEQMGRLAVVVRDSSDAITVQDFDGFITAWNPGAERMYGYSEKEAVGMEIAHLIPEEKRQEEREVSQQIIVGNSVPPFKTVRCAKGGARVEVMVISTALCDKVGNPYAIATTERPLVRPNA
ncbi:MAG: PAS domain-containing protein [Magnetococcales bacterium]|nr:PAS domain-containing protein [Magnetococcales bacterium]